MIHEILLSAAIGLCLTFLAGLAGVALYLLVLEIGLWVGGFVAVWLFITYHIYRDFNKKFDKNG